MDDRPSERIIDQRVRIRAIEAVEVLAEGDDGVRKVGNVDHVSHFFDVIDDEGSPAWRDLSTYDPAEVTELEKVQSLLLDACAATPEICTSDEFIASGWPERIKPVAANTLALTLSRGRLSRGPRGRLTVGLIEPARPGRPADDSCSSIFAEARSGGEVGEEPSDVVVSDAPCQPNGAGAVAVCVIRICARRAQDPDDPRVAPGAEYGLPQRRVSVLVLGVHDRASFEQEPNHVGVLLLSGELQRRHAFAVGQAHLSTSSDEVARDCDLPCTRRIVETDSASWIRFAHRADTNRKLARACSSIFASVRELVDEMDAVLRAVRKSEHPSRLREHCRPAVARGGDAVRNAGVASVSGCQIAVPRRARGSAICVITESARDGITHGAGDGIAERRATHAAGHNREQGDRHPSEQHRAAGSGLRSSSRRERVPSATTCRKCRIGESRRPRSSTVREAPRARQASDEESAIIDS